MRSRLAVLALPALLASGCSSCHDDHPYVPYTIGSAEGAAGGSNGAIVAAPSVSVPAGDAGGAFPHELAVLAPVGLATWAVEGVSLEAPAGATFVSAVVRDFDGDGVKDAFAIVRGPEPADAGKLVFFHGTVGAGSSTVADTFEAPADGPPVGHPPECLAVQRLSLVGTRAVLVELGAQCTAGPSSRWIAVVAAQATARVRLAATVADPLAVASLAVDADTTDRDGDGLPDMALRVTMEGGGPPFEPGPRVTATLAWLDRSAGLSRDAAATDASFGALAASAMARAKSTREAAGVPAFVAQARSLWRAVCADGGAPRLVGVIGTGSITCGSAKSLEELGLAEARAYVTAGDPLRSALAIDRAERAPASRTPARVAEARSWLAPLVPVVTVPSVRAVAAVPLVPHGHEPAWGSLTFEPGGKLLVRTRAGVVRVDPDAGDEASADGVAAWTSAVASPDSAMRWIETYDPCDGFALRATFAPANGDDMRDVALPVAPALGDRCTGSRGAPARALPVAWGPGGLEAIVEGAPVLVASDLGRASPLGAFLGSPVAPGAPRSPDGKTLVVPTSGGLLVRGARSSLLKAPALDGTYADQRDCAVTNDGTHVACVRDGKAWVGNWGMP